MQEKKLGSPEGQTPPVKLEPTLFGLEVEIQRLVPQAKGGGLVMPAGREARAQVGKGSNPFGVDAQTLYVSRIMCM